MERRPLTGEKELEFLARLAQPTGRRSFLKWSGVSLAVVAAGCSDERAGGPLGSGRQQQEPDGTISLGMGDVAVLNYALALEQLEAAFFTQVGNGAFFQNTATAEERQILDDIRKHEVIHREFYFRALGDAAIPPLEFDFTDVDFGSRQSVLETSRVFEDLGVAAYNGAAQLLENVDFLVIAGKIVSNEARHASAIRSLLQPRTTFFAGDDIVDENGLERFLVPAQVFPMAAAFIVGSERIDISGLPEPTVTP